MSLHFRLSLTALLCCIAIPLSGCGAGIPPSPASLQQRDATPSPMSQSQPVVEDGGAASTLELVQPMAASGPGTMVYSSGTHLSSQQERVILDYMDLYYQSMADLNAQSPSALFASDAQDQARLRQGVWETMVEVRKAQPVNLSLTSYAYQMTCTSVSTNDEGYTSVTLSENAVQRFSAHPEVNAESMNIIHRFTLAQTSDGWLLRSHSQMDAANRLASGRSMQWARGDNDSEAQMEQRRQALISSHIANVADRKSQIASYHSGTAVSLTWDNDYDRDAAVAYANDWVGARNTASWPTYDRSGGNCQNYTSQAVLAGGIPMDYTGTSQWKWYGSASSSSPSATGRSASWSSVSAFYSYAKSNSGYGMVAQADANFGAGEPGDLVQLGYDGDWRHVVIITQVVRDENGNVVDYLISSNTADLRHYPLSAYLYPQQRLIKIYGWNNS